MSNEIMIRMKKPLSKTNDWGSTFYIRWEHICLDALGQKKYNETRGLSEDHKGIDTIHVDSEIGE